MKESNWWYDFGRLAPIMFEYCTLSVVEIKGNIYSLENIIRSQCILELSVQ